jgi:ABC-type antimicrobial peptide transport system permease subunit
MRAGKALKTEALPVQLDEYCLMPNKRERKLVARSALFSIYLPAVGRLWRKGFYSHMAFAFRITPSLLLTGFIFALLMGIIGGVPPAIRASRTRIAYALREL